MAKTISDATAAIQAGVEANAASIATLQAEVSVAVTTAQAGFADLRAQITALKAEVSGGALEPMLTGLLAAADRLQAQHDAIDAATTALAVLNPPGAPQA